MTRQMSFFALRRGPQSGCAFGSVAKKVRSAPMRLQIQRGTAYLCRTSFMFAQDAIEGVIPAFEASVPSFGGGRDRFAAGRGSDDVSDRVAVAIEESGSDCMQEVGNVGEGEDALVGDAKDEVEVVGEEPEDRVGVLVPSRDLASSSSLIARGGGG